VEETSFIALIENVRKKKKKRLGVAWATLSVVFDSKKKAEVSHFRIFSAFKCNEFF
jgi:hypothetical protein